LKDEYHDLETTLSDEVLKHAAQIPEIYLTIKEEEVMFLFVNIFKKIYSRTKKCLKIKPKSSC
jgi:hypothetical protein